jgi:hypothetical protein
VTTSRFVVYEPQSWPHLRDQGGLLLLAVIQVTVLAGAGVCFRWDVAGALHYRAPGLRVPQEAAFRTSRYV